MMTSRLRPFLMISAIAGIVAGGALLPGSAGADPYAPALAPWDSQYARFGLPVTETPQELIENGDQALAESTPQRIRDARGKAMEYYERAMSFAIRTGARAAEGEAALRLARLCFDRRYRSGCSSNSIQKILTYFEKVQAKDLAFALQIRLGDMRCGAGKPTEADFEYRRASWAPDLRGRGPELAKAYRELAWEFFNTGDFEGSLQAKRKSLSLDAQMGSQPDVDAEIAALDKRALADAEQKISQWNQAEEAKAAAARAAGGGATGSIAAPTAGRPGTQNIRAVCEVLRSLQKGGAQHIKPEPLPSFCLNQ